MWVPSVNLIKDQDPTSYRGPMGDPWSDGPLGSGPHLTIHSVNIRITGELIM